MRIGYARVSTTHATQDASILGQQQQLEAAGCDRVISERLSAFSGTRPGWQELWALVAGGQIEEVVVVDQSRLSRSGDDLEFLEVCALQGVTVRALVGGVIEVETVGGFVAAGVLSVVNRAHSKLLSVKSREGIRRRREAGFLGHSALPFGYRAVAGRAAPDPDTWAAARARFDGLMAAGMSTTRYLRDSGERVSRHGLQLWVRNPMLRGFAHGRWGGVEALITFAEYQQAERLMAQLWRASGATPRRQRAFSSLVSCQQCGERLHYVVARPQKREPLRLQCRRPWCPWYGRTLRADHLREVALDALRGVAQQMAELHGTRQAEPPELVSLRAQLEQLQQLQGQGVQGLTGAVEGLQQQIKALAAPPSTDRLGELAAAMAAPGFLDDADDAELRALLIEFVESIVFTGSPRGVEITTRHRSEHEAT